MTIWSDASSSTAGLKNAFKFLEIPLSWFFYSSFRIKLDSYVQSFKVRNVGKYTGVTTNVFFNILHI